MRVAQEKVAVFHDHTGQPARNEPTALERPEAEYRNFIMQSEMDELKEGLLSGDLVEIADGAADLIYTVLGTCVACGIDLAPIFDEVHSSNMTKDRNPAQGRFGAEKPLKGPNFRPPRIAELLIMQER